jgi:hypothetical protein
LFDLEWIKDNVPGIIEAFYPGENGAQAIADVVSTSQLINWIHLIYTS